MPKVASSNLACATMTIVIIVIAVYFTIGSLLGCFILIRGALSNFYMPELSLKEVWRGKRLLFQTWLLTFLFWLPIMIVMACAEKPLRRKR
jgi:hypothetical protein